MPTAARRKPTDAVAVLTTTHPPRRLARMGQAFTFDGPAAAIVRRDVGRMVQSRMFRILVIGLSGANLMIAYAMLQGPLHADEMEYTVRTIVFTQGMFLYATGFAFTAARAGTCIGTERARGTWEMMWLTPASPSAIVFGHLASSLAPAMLLTVSQFPILAPLVYACGPTIWPSLAAATAIGVTSWVACALWAFWASAQFNDFGRALAGAFLAAVWASGIATFMVVGALVLFSSWNSPNWNPSFISAELLRIASPIMELYYLITYGVRRVSLAPHLAFMLATAFIPLYFGTRAIRREQNTSSQPVDNRPRTWRGGASNAPAIIKSLAIPDWMNPVFAIEHHAAIAARTRLGMWLFVMVSAFAVYLNYRTLEYPLVVESAGGIALLLVVALGRTAWASASGSVISDERETFDMVAMTKLRARDIQRGKVLAALASVVPVVILLAVCMTVAAIVGSAWTLGLFCFLTFLLCIAMLVSSGLFASVLARGTRESVITNFLIGVCTFFGVPILCRTIIGLLQDAVILNWFGIRRWFDPAIAAAENSAALVDATSPISGLIHLLRNPERSEAWFIWGIGAAMAVCWSVLWYNTAGWILRRKLEGKPVWSLEMHPKE